MFHISVGESVYLLTYVCPINKFRMPKSREIKIGMGVGCYQYRVFLNIGSPDQDQVKAQGHHDLESIEYTTHNKLIFQKK